MKSYNRLTQEERYYIFALKASHVSIRQIAKLLNRSHSSISREISRNCEQGRYSPSKAQKKALKRRQSIGPPLKIKGALAKAVRRGLQRQWSPEQISGRLKKEEGIRISHESIYQYVFRNFKKGGDLFTQVRDTMKLLLTKYLKAFISYKGLYRVESYPVPESALREALINAVVHRNYGSGAPIQIRVYPDKIIFGNTCRLPSGWTVKDLTSKKQSEPYNPDIARVFFWANMIETWGRGIIQMQKACVAYGAPEPKIGGSESHIHVEFKNHEADMAEKLAKKVVLQDTGEKTREKTREKILNLISSSPTITMKELAREVGVTEKGIEWQISELKQLGYLKRIGPDKGGYWAVVRKDKE